MDWVFSISMFCGGTLSWNNSWTYWKASELSQYSGILFFYAVTLFGTEIRFHGHRVCQLKKTSKWCHIYVSFTLPVQLFQPVSNTSHILVFLNNLLLDSWFPVGLQFNTSSLRCEVWYTGQCSLKWLALIYITKCLTEVLWSLTIYTTGFSKVQVI
jgi:hypothetical protein